MSWSLAALSCVLPGRALRVCRRSNQNCGTEDYQAAVVANVIARLKLIANIAAFFWYRQTDGIGNWYGLNRTDLSQKPAWQTYATAIAS